jgi:hypothetical protein
MESFYNETQALHSTKGDGSVSHYAFVAQLSQGLGVDKPLKKCLGGWPAHEASSPG